MLQIPDNPNLDDLQKYVRRLEEERGFTDSTLQQQCLQLGEEVGELFKAIRKHQNMRLDANSKVGTPDEELADILIYVLAIANRLDIDLEEALRAKEEVNKTRTWSV